MDLYRTNLALETRELIEDYESYIWTDRYSGYGDFELVVKENHQLTGSLRYYKYLTSSFSNRVMMVENVDIQNQASGEDNVNLVKITGRSIEAFLENRTNKTPTTRNPEQVISSPAGIVKYMIDKYCVNPATAGPVNVIPNLSAWESVGGANVTLQVPRGDMYTMAKTICDTYGLGFMIFKNPGDPELTFMVYKGYDASLPNLSYYKEYSADAETLLNTSTFESIAGYKNHARVSGAKTGVDVYIPGFDSTVSGFDRRTLAVDAYDVGTDSSTTIAEDQAALRIRGLKELAKANNRYQRLIDGDIPQDKWNDTYYSLGNIVMVKDTYGVRTKMKITETIWSSDANGDMRTPTFEELE